MSSGGGSSVVAPDFYATAAALFEYTARNATLRTTEAPEGMRVPVLPAMASTDDGIIGGGGGVGGGLGSIQFTAANHSSTAGLPPRPDINASLWLYGIILILIPTITILGNLLVIVSVLRFKALHSAINFLILGLAFADLFVALFVMPYAVYVHVQGGAWYLGPLMCDIYSASDVACSTASILLLAVISFDRYRAVSRPIQYSRQSQNIQRVVVILIAIWFISLALASPIVLGVNNRPADASPYECRFYNPEFSIISSMVSFVIPCFIVLFVYIRIMMALRKREKAAKARRQANQQSDGCKEKTGDYDDAEEAGQIVAGPDDHELAGSWTPRSSTDSLSENVNVVTNDFVSEGPTSVSRRSSDFDSSLANNTMSSLTSSTFQDRSDRSAISEFKRKKMKSSLYFHRRSLTMPSVNAANLPSRRTTSTAREPFLPAIIRQISKRSPRLFRALPGAVHGNGSIRKGDRSRKDKVESVIIENCATGTPNHLRRELNSMPIGEENMEEETDQLLPSPSPEAATVLATVPLAGNNLSASQTTIIRRTALANSDSSRLQTQSKSTSDVTNDDGVSSEVLDCVLATTSVSAKLPMEAMVIENRNACDSPAPPLENKRLKQVRGGEECGSPSVSFNIAGKTFFGGARGNSTVSSVVSEGGGFPRRRSSCMETWSVSNKPSGSSMGMPSSISSNVISSETGANARQRLFMTRRGPKHSKSQHSIDSSGSLQNPSVSSSNKALEAKRKLLSNPKLNGSSTALAVRIVKRTINRKESSLKRKVTKAQRKERRATKTLGIVVGIFLICWVPFFTINILNAVCILFESPSCEVGFGPFFYATWIGYMNSCMNPVIYTIFNTEFRRAFKSLICGRNPNRRHRARNV